MFNMNMIWVVSNEFLFIYTIDKEVESRTDSSTAAETVGFNLALEWVWALTEKPPFLSKAARLSSQG